MTNKYRFPMIFMIFLAVTPVMSIYIPRFIAFWPLIIGLCTCYWLLFVKKELFHISRLYYVVAGIISLLCLASSFWSISPMQSAEDAVKATALLMFGGLMVSGFKAMDMEDLKPYGWFLPVGLIVAALLGIFDLNNDLTIYKVLHPTDDPGLNSSVLNRGLICCVFAFFCTIPFIQSLEWKDSQKFWLIAATGIALVTVLSLGQSQSSQVAFALGLVVFFAFPVRWKFSYIAFGTILVASLLSTPFIVDMLYEQLIGQYELLADQSEGQSWVQEAYVGNRVEIWNFVMEYAMNNPLYGYGIEATDYVRHYDFDHIYNEKDTILHPHNFSVQLWMEFGLIGIALIAITFGVLLFMILKTENILARKSLTALFVVILLVASMTYGLWQSWWIGELLFMLALGTLLSNKDAAE